jgi:uncharacterized protein (TIGR03435 family)
MAGSLRKGLNMLSRVWIMALAALAALGQSNDQLRFDVASVKPSPPPQPNARRFFGPPRGGPGTRDPARITWENAALGNMLMTAYDVQMFQIDAPDWLATARYNVIANVPEGATKEQVRVMWQNLLKDRFGMLLHHKSDQFQVDDLTVAKGGPKLKETDLGPNPDPFTPVDGPDKNGAPRMNGFGAIILIRPDGSATMFAKAVTLADFAVRLGQQLRHPVIDKTGLSGRFDFTLDYAIDLTGIPVPRPPEGQPLADSPLPDVARAVEKQLGLNLTPAKAQLDVIVVDRAQKVPTEN